MQTVYNWLSHPFLLLITGAIVSTYLIPMLTRRWQDHQKELELKINLVEQISEIVTKILVSVQFVVVGAKSQSQNDFDTVYREWEIQRSRISSRLKAYFPRTTIGSDWDTFSALVTDFYALAGIPEKDRRNEHLRKIQGYSFFNSVNVDWDALMDKGSNLHSPTHWFSLHPLILRQKDELIQSILNSSIWASKSKFLR